MVRRHGHMAMVHRHGHVAMVRRQGHMAMVRGQGHGHGPGARVKGVYFCLICGIGGGMNHKTRAALSPDSYGGQLTLTIVPR